MNLFYQELTFSGNCFFSILLERGADPNQEDLTQCIPSFVAQRSGNVECYRVLIHHINERTQTLAQNAAEVSYSL